MNESTINGILGVLDAQLANCIKTGARFNPARAPYFCIDGGNEPQNTFYKGNVNMAEAAVIAAYPGKEASIIVDRAGVHQIAFGRA